MTQRICRGDNCVICVEIRGGDETHLYSFVFAAAYFASLVWRKSFGFWILDAVEDVIGFVQVIFDCAFDLVRLSGKICWD